ncbi:hypothetical protein AVEN_236757-1 [Araneus ventricosus]|uniref:Tc1-like transposase DDE domain-containing protein n=1 Tax=Araneus ventricosus TaxID=182803 RepID=A0A4Y2JDG1_ARAVE|nr:hypothetical protein AVEN_236757-1 [Araneus ventricosus]
MSLLKRERSVAVLEQFVATVQALEDRRDTSWLMQDETRLHRTRVVFAIIEEYFENRFTTLIYSAFTGIGMDWPPFSPDLIPVTIYCGAD